MTWLLPVQDESGLRPETRVRRAALAEQRSSSREWWETLQPAEPLTWPWWVEQGSSPLCEARYWARTSDPSSSSWCSAPVSDPDASCAGWSPYGAPWLQPVAIS